jgi:signal transduction histidine kinase
VVGLANHTVLIRRDKSEIAIDDSGAPIRNEAGDLIGIVMVFRDVTVERRTHAALLANERLAVAGRLAATIAHEIHNPLDSVANLLYLLQHDPRPEDEKHFLELAQSELTRVTQISRAMLGLYRESHAPVPIDLKETIEEVLLLIEGRIHALGIQLTSELAPDVVVDGFPGELRQVFTNLITNAIEAAGKDGSVRVRVTQHKMEPAPAVDGALIEITDSGPGIAPDVRDRLFQPFVTTKGEQGTGLGLWVSQGIVRKIGGSIDLIANAGGPGTTARVFLARKPVLNPGGD